MNRLLKIFKIKDLRNKVFFILALLVIYRLAAAIPVPVADAGALRRFLATSGAGELFGLISTFTGGGLSGFSVVMLGVGPYITASIIMQLLTMIFPSLERMYKYEGEAGRQKVNQYSRMLIVPLAIVQGYAYLVLLSRQGQGIVHAMTPIEWVVTLVTLAAGSMFLTWLGELMTEKNLGNGVSLIIFAGIVAGAPQSISQLLINYQAGALFEYLAFIVLALVVIAGVVYLTEAQRNIPINYAKRIRGSHVLGGVSTYLPMRVNNAGVMPIIFALSLLLFPSMIGRFLAVSHTSWLQAIGNFINTYIASGGWIYGILYFLLVVLFTYFYTAITFDPKSISENIQKQGGYIPGIRPGQPTAQFLVHLLNRVTLVGAIFLGLIAVLPQIVRSATGITAFALGGTSILIVVSVALELMKAVDGQVSMYEY